MHEVVERRRGEIAALCRSLGVRRLDVFGSAVVGGFTKASDVDVLVEFDDASQAGRFDVYFALKEGLERLLGRPVDVVVAAGLVNPYVRAEIMRSRENLYAA